MLVLHQNKSADFTGEENKKWKHVFLSKRIFHLFRFKANILRQKEANIFKKEPNINWSLRLVKGLPIQFEAIRSEYFLVCKYLQVNDCKRIFAWMWSLLKILGIFASKWIFWSKYSLVWENVKRIFALKRIMIFANIPKHAKWSR